MTRRSTVGAAMLAAGLWSGTASAADGTAQQDLPKWAPWLDLEGKAGTKRNLGEADAFLPIFQDDDTLVFGNAKFRLDDRDSLEGNLGLGLRHMLDGGWNLGAYGYADRRRSETGELYNQVTFGVEALGADFDLRANSYWPLGDKVRRADRLNKAYLSGTTIFLRGGEEHALRGFDAEVGWRVPVFDAAGPLDLRLYGGGFTFEDPDDSDVPDVTGPRLRAEFTAYEVPYLWDGARLTLGAEWQHDDVRGGQGFASLRLRIPLQVFGEGKGPRLTAQERRMAAPVVRDVDIVTQAGDFGATEVATATAGSNSLTVLDSGSTSGANLPAAVANAGANSTVILSGTFNTTAATVLQSGQTLMGAGTVTVKTPSGRTATLTISAATIAGAVSGGNASTIEMAANSTLSGLTVSNTIAGNSRAVFLNGVDNVAILDNTLTATSSGVAAYAIRTLGNIDTLLIRGNRITATAGNLTYGISMNYVGTTETNVTVAGNTFDASGGSGNYAINAYTTTFTAASTGNVVVSGACGGGSANNTGRVSFTNGTTCP